MQKITCTIDVIGKQALNMLNENMLITYSSTAPIEDLLEYSVGITIDKYCGEIKSKDKLIIGQLPLTITSLGDKVNENFKELGHTTVRFDSASTPTLPGSLHVTYDKSLLNYIKPGNSIIIEGD